MSGPSSDKGAAGRPRRVTVGAGLALTGCVLLIFSMLDSMARVRSVDTREGVTDFLSRPPGSGLGLEVDQVMTVLRLMVFVTGGLAAAGAVLAVYVLLRHRAARVALTVTAVLLVVSSMFGSLLLPLMVAFGVMLVWSREGREWFGDRPRRATAGPAMLGGAAFTTTASAGWTHDAPAGASTAPEVSAPGPRPRAVTVAAVLTWVFGGVTGFVFALLVLSLLVQQEQLLADLAANPSVGALGLTPAQLVGALWVVAAVGVTWCLASVALAVLAFRRVNAARILLVVSAVIAGVVALPVVPFGWPNAAAAFAAAALLMRSASNRWYAAARADDPRPDRWQGPW
ncbi:MAG: hypothetical protein WB441_09250, partial [Nocardioidaceae bacterium]